MENLQLSMRKKNVSQKLEEGGGETYPNVSGEERTEEYRIDV